MNILLEVTKLLLSGTNVNSTNYPDRGTRYPRRELEFHMSKLMLSMTAVAAIALGGHALAQTQTPTSPPPSSDQASPGNAPTDSQSATPAAPAQSDTSSASPATS